MKMLDDVEAAFTATRELLVARGIAVVRAQSVAASEATVWIDVEGRAELLAAANTIADTCGIRFVVEVPAVDDDEEERSFLFVGDALVGLRFGVDVEDGDEDEVEPPVDHDPVAFEEEVRRLSAQIVERVSATPGVEPSHRARIRQLLDATLSEEEADPLVARRLRSASPRLEDDIAVNVRRRHQMGFATQAHELAERFRGSHPDVSLAKVTIFRPRVIEFLRSIDPDCTTRDAAEPVVQALRTPAATPPTGLF